MKHNVYRCRLTDFITKINSEMRYHKMYQNIRWTLLGCFKIKKTINKDRKKHKTIKL